MPEHPSKATILALASDGVKPGLIAQQIGCSPHTVYWQLRQARRAGLPVPRYQPGSGWAGRRVLISLPVMPAAIIAAAQQRGMAPRDLAALILTTVADNALIDAVLDDQEVRHE